MPTAAPALPAAPPADPLARRDLVVEQPARERSAGPVAQAVLAGGRLRVRALRR